MMRRANWFDKWVRITPEGHAAQAYRDRWPWDVDGQSIARKVSVHTEIDGLLAAITPIADLKCRFCGWTRFAQHKKGDDIGETLRRWVEDLAQHIQSKHAEDCAR